MLRVALVLVICACSHLVGTPAQCISCHPAETKLHMQTRMAHAMLPGPSSAFGQHAIEHRLHESADGFEFTYTVAENTLKVEARKGNQAASGIIEWVLGAGSQGQTPLVRAGDNLFESRVSYFPKLNQFGITIGQPAGSSALAETALGLKESKRDATSCLMCHSTGLTSDLEPVLPGVQCERCHAGSEQHALDGKGQVVNPGKLSAFEQVKLCGTCHRIKPPVGEQQLENVRFQPLRLIKSACFGSGKLACTTCHPAHQDAKRNDAAFYNEKCAACHSTAATGLHSDERRTGNCIGCHMQVVQLHPALKFTDHYIRVLSVPESNLAKGAGLR